MKIVISAEKTPLHNRRTRALYFLLYLLPLYPVWTNNNFYKKCVVVYAAFFRSNSFTLWSKTLSINAQHYRLKIINHIPVFMWFLILNRLLNNTKADHCEIRWLLCLFNHGFDLENRWIYTERGATLNDRNFLICLS